MNHKNTDPLRGKSQESSPVRDKIRLLGLCLKRWHLYLILSLSILVLVGCAAGLLMLGGSALSGSSSGGSGYSSGSSGVKSISGLVFSQGSANSIAPLGGATVTAQWGGTRSVTKAPARQKQTTTNSDGSYELGDIDANVNVDVIIEKDGHTVQTQTVNTGNANPQAKGILNRRNQNTKTAFKDTDNDINTTQDINDNGESLPRCHIIIPAGALTNDTQVELTPYFSMNNLPAPIPDGFIGLAGADFTTSVSATFVSGKEAKPYIILPDDVRAEDLSTGDIKLMEFIGGNWVIVKDAANQDKKCKYYSSGPYQGLLGPDDNTAQETERAKITAVHPFCFVHRVSQQATINGTVTNNSGTPIHGAMVFGGGSSTTTDSLGNYTLSRIIVLSNTLDTLIIVNAVAPDYQLSSAAAAVDKTTFVADDIDITLQTLLEDVAIIGGQVKDTVAGTSIPGAKVTCSSNAETAAFVYDNKNSLDLSDDVISVTPRTGASYQWWITSPFGSNYRSSQSNNSVILNDLFMESRFNSLGAYRVDLDIVLSDRTIPVMAGFLLQIVGLNVRLTDIKLPITSDSSVKLESYSNTNGIYRLIGVPCGVDLQLQASKSGYQPSDIRTVSALYAGQTKEENFFISQGVSTIASILINPSPSVSLISNQQVQFTAIAYDNAGNSITPTPVFTWTSSNNAVASINNSGSLTASASGTTIIRASGSGILSNQVTVYVSSGVPNPPTNLITTTVNASSIAISWTDNSNDETAFNIERSEDGSNFLLLIAVGVNTAVYTNTGLTANTTYYYRVYASNASGNSGTSNVVSATTSAPLAPTAATNFATNITMNSATLQGSVNPNGVATNVYFNYGLTNSYAFTTTAQAIGSDTMNVFVTSDISGLTQNMTYHFRVAATNGSGTTHGLDRTFSTGSGSAPTANTDPATNVTAYSAYLNGTVNPNGSDTKAYFQWGLTTSYTISTTYQSIGSGATGVSVYYNPTSLSSNMSYNFRVVGNSTYGTSYGTNMSFTTGSGAGSPPTCTTNAADNITSNSARFNGTVNPNGSVANFYFEYGTGVSPISYSLSTTPQSIGNGNTSVAVSATASGTLAPSINYNFRVTAYNYYGTTYGSNLSFTTGSGAGSAPTCTTNAATNVAANSATLNGTVNPNGLSTSAYFQWGTSASYGNSTTSQAIGSGNAGFAVSNNISGLLSNTQYNFRVVGTNSYGTNYGTNTIFTTTTSGSTTAVDDYVWGTNWGSNNVTRIQKSTSITTTITVGTNPYGVAVDETYAWVTNGGSNSVTRIKKSDLTTTTIGVGGGPQGIALDTTYVWVVNNNLNSVTRILKSDLSITTTIATGTQPNNLAVDATYVWVTNWGSNNVTRITKSDLSTTAITVGSLPVGVAVDETYCWVANDGSNTVSRIQKSNPAISTTITVGTTPYGLAVDATYVWVANYGSNNVTRILKSDLSKATITVGSVPYGVAVDDTYCWVANKGSNNVTRILKSDSTKTTITVGNSPFSNGDMTGYAFDNYSRVTAGSAPTCTTDSATNVAANSATLNGTVNPNGQNVTSCYFEYGQGVSYGNQQNVITFPGSGTSPIPVTANVSSLAVDTQYNFRVVATNAGGTTYGNNLTFTASASAVDDYIWVANYYNDNVTRIQKSTSITTTIAVGDAPWGVTVDGIYCWVANASSNTVTRILKSNPTVTTTIGAGNYPRGVAVDETYCWVADYGSNYVTRIRKSDLTTNLIAVGTQPNGITVDGTYVWVTNQGSNNVTRIRKSDSTATTIAVGSSPNGIAVDETYCWVVNQGNDSVTRITKSTSITTTIVVGSSPYGIAVDETYCWVTNAGSNNVTRILKSALTTSTIAVGTNPRGVAVDGTYCWVINYNSNNITRILKSTSTTTTIAVETYPLSMGDTTGYAFDNYSRVP